MNLRVNQLQQPTQLEPKAPVTESDGSFRFTLLSSIEEQELRASLAVMMEDITQQGNKLSRKMDIRDMKLYRKMIGSTTLNATLTSALSGFSSEISLLPSNAFSKYGFSVKDVSSFIFASPCSFDK